MTAASLQMGGVALLIALLLVPGYLAERAVSCLERSVTGPFERLIVWATASVLLVGWLALILAEVGLFRLSWLTGAVALACLGLAWLAWRQPRGDTGAHDQSTTSGSRIGEAVFALLALVFLASLLTPHLTVVGGADAGVYANTGASLAHNGSLIIEDRLTRDLAPTAAAARVATETSDLAAGQDGAVRHLLGRLPEGRFPFADYLRLVGFYVLDLTAGTVVPQFLHLYPTWLAVFALTLGDRSLFLATPVIGWLGAVLLALTGRRLYGDAVGSASLILLLTNAMERWFLRLSLSEALLQFLLCATAYGWAVAHRREDRPANGPPTLDRPALLLAGVAFGSFGLAHAQFVFGFALLVPLALWLRLSRRWQPAYWAFFGPVLALLVHASFHIAFFALGYVEGLYHHVVLDAWAARWRWLVFGAAAVLVLAVLDRTREQWWPLVTTRRYRLPRTRWLTPRAVDAAPMLLAVVVGLVLAYAYLLRPNLVPWRWPVNLADLEPYIGAPVERGNEATLVRLGWYFSPLGMLLGGVGLVAMARRFQPAHLALLGLAAIYGLAFNLASFTHEGYIYSLRRFIPIVVPVLTLASAYACVHTLPAVVSLGRRTGLWPMLGRAVGASAAAALVLFFLVTGRTMGAQVDYAETRDQVARIAAHFAPGDTILFAGPRDEPHTLATPLRFFHDLDTLVVSTNNPRGDLIDAWLSQQLAGGHRVWLVLGTGGGKLVLPGHRLVADGQATIALRVLETLPNQKPYNVQTNIIDYTIFRLEPADGRPLAGLPFRWRVGPGDEPSTVIGWYNREADTGGVTYRWTTGQALLRVPWAPTPGRHYRVRLRLASGTRPASRGPASVGLSLARGQNDPSPVPLASVPVAADFQTHEVIVPADALPAQPDGTAMLVLTTSAWQPAQTGLSTDSRALGVMVAEVELLPAD